ncbi:N-acylglucosamine 2-epimerase [Agarivorans sp. B2Z047]|uniref:AGE family epimerase/isomerase n=1 Tax=Agarivorans TaxID=261825 RepID=UPI00128DD56B|nr:MULTISPECIES: AGE family epimerase/isomerase [Agarivorans]MPW31461.1 N-acylglucosamine 2-epimerase [Agarivorans sp. B2Z047]UQN42503.1 AGE family epimerase/isomerase [Agarivorans sp. B2Z047]
MKLQDFKQEMAHEVDNNILSFWLEMIDKENGGFHCFADFNGTVDKEHDKAVLLHSRILWSFSAAHRILPNDKYLAAAKHAYLFIKEQALDRENGGVYWMLDSKGKVKDPQKHIYNQGFAIYALTEYFRISKDLEALDIAKGLFELIESNAYDKVNGGYIEAFDQHWQPIENHLVCDTSEEVLAEKSMNTHLHILEAYANLHRVWPDELVEQRLSELLVLFRDTIVDEDLHFGLFFSREWQCVSKDVSYGHDIEGTWLLDDAAACISDKQLSASIYALTTKMADVTLQQGRDADGAIFNELQHGKMLDSDRIWWVQAEAMVGFYNAFQKDFDPRYWAVAQDCWKIIKNQIVDTENGEWHWKTDRQGNPYTGEAKVEPWKCPYHNGRACLEIYSRITSYEENSYACC